MMVHDAHEGHDDTRYKMVALWNSNRLASEALSPSDNGRLEKFNDVLTQMLV